MNRYTLCKIFKAFSHLNYRVTVTGTECICPEGVHLMMPNHTAYIDPVLLAGEFWHIPFRPMVDERFLRHPIFGPGIRLGDPILVPDLGKSALSREEGARIAASLTGIALDALRDGKDLLFYPSGHIKLRDTESIGNRRMAYEVCRDLPEGVQVLLCRVRGLEGSYFSKLKTTWRWRRRVTIHIEDHTDELRHLAQTLTRREFNQHLEDWYNQNEQMAK